MSDRPLVVLAADRLAELIESAVEKGIAAHEPNLRSEWIDSAAAAELLGVHRRTVIKLAARRALPSSRIGRLLRFRRADVEAFLAGDGRANKRGGDHVGGATMATEEGE